MSQPFHAGKLRRNDLHRRHLLGTVTEELAADHGDVGIDARAAEAIGGGMDAHKTLAGLDGRQELLLSLRRHRRARLRMVGLPGQIAGGVKDEGVVLVEIAVEYRAVLAAHHLEPGGLPSR